MRGEPLPLRMSGTAWTVVMTVLLLARGAAADDPAPATPKSEAALFRWWDGLGYPDIRRAPLVRAATGSCMGQPRKAVYEYAFLLSDAGGEFRLFTTDLRTQAWKKSDVGAAECDQVGYVAEDLEDFVRCGVEKMRSVPGPTSWFEEDRSLDAFEAHRWKVPNQAFRLLVLARACDGRGLSELAHALCELALREQGPLEGYTPRPDAPFEVLKARLAAEAPVAAIEHLGDPMATLVELRDEFARVTSVFPDFAKTSGLPEGVATLDRMISETQESKKRHPASGIDASSSERIEDLVLGLRDAHAVWSSWRGDTTVGGPLCAAPAFIELVRIGAPAVPRLIAALDDHSFTRTVLRMETGHGQRRGGTWPYRVSDAALDALDTIACRGFRVEEQGHWGFGKSDEKGLAALRAGILEWWDTFQREGEPKLLAAIVAKADERASLAAWRLVERYPDQALAPLREGIGAAAPTIGAWLVQVAGRMASPQATDFLLTLLRTDSRPLVRLSAAKALKGRDGGEGVRVMTQEWLHPSAPPRPGESLPDHDLPFDPRGFDRKLLQFLADSGSPEAYRALATNLGRKSADYRFRVVFEFLRGDEPPPTHSAGGCWGGFVPPAPPAPLDAEARRAVEALLGERLSDPEEVRWTFSIGDVDGDSRLGVAAARALALMLPEVYRFDPKALPKERERQRGAAEDLWRARKDPPK